MGLQSAIQSLQWPTLLTALAYISSTTILVVLNKLVMSVLLFRYPVTLTLIQTSSVAICLWFWTIFGLFKVRSLPKKPLFHLAFAAAFCSTLNMLSLRHNSILFYQAIRMLTAPVIGVSESLLGVRHRSNLRPAVISMLCAAVGAILLLCLEEGGSSFGPLTAVGSLCATSLYQVGNLSIRKKLRASEMQLQLMLKTVSCLCLILFLPIFDDYRLATFTSIFQFEFEEGSTLFIFSTGLLAFISFTAMRATINRLSATSYNNAVHIASLAIFLSHFVILEYEMTVFHLIGISAVMSGSALFSSISSLSHSDSGRRRQTVDSGQYLSADESLSASELELIYAERAQSPATPSVLIERAEIRGWVSTDSRHDIVQQTT